MCISAVDIWFVNLGIRLSDWTKCFYIKDFPVYYYGCIIAASFLLGLTVALILAKKTGQDPDTYYSLVIFDAVAGILGARLYYVAFAWDEYKDNLLEVFNLRGGGLAIYGGVIAAVIATAVYCKKKHLNIGQVLDTAGCGLILGQCTGRWSNFVNMEVFGGYSDGPFAMALNVQKINPAMISAEQLAKEFTVDGVTYIQAHPTFLYESLWSLGTLIIMLMITRKKKFHGQVFLIYMMGYGLGRFWIEGVRTDQLLIPGTALPVSQMLSAVIILAALVLYVIRDVRTNKARARYAQFMVEEAIREAEEEGPASEENAFEGTEHAAYRTACRVDSGMKLPGDGEATEKEAEAAAEASPAVKKKAEAAAGASAGETDAADVK